VSRLPTETEMEDVCEGLQDGLLARMGEPTWLAWKSDVRTQIKNLIATVVEEAVLEDPEVLSRLGLGKRPVPVRRARAFLLDPAAVEPLVCKLGGSMPRVTEMTLDIASAGIFFLIAPWRLGRGLGRLPVRWAVAGGHYGLFLEFGPTRAARWDTCRAHLPAKPLGSSGTKGLPLQVTNADVALDQWLRGRGRLFAQRAILQTRSAFYDGNPTALEEVKHV
jgi:hypothetical protein